MRLRRLNFALLALVGVTTAGPALAAAVLTAVVLAAAVPLVRARVEFAASPQALPKWVGLKGLHHRHSSGHRREVRLLTIDLPLWWRTLVYVLERRVTHIVYAAWVLGDRQRIPLESAATATEFDAVCKRAFF